MNKPVEAGALTISIVSHGHANLITPLLQDLASCSEATHILLTYNISERPASIPPELASRTTSLSNPKPLGYGANHNAAFHRCRTEFFCVMNPDVRLHTNPFPILLSAMSGRNVGLTAPAVVNPDGRPETTARIFPTPPGLLLKAARVSDGGIPFRLGDPPSRPDWIAGMFLLLRSSAFAAVGGFDESFFLYYEDVDLCARLRKAGCELLFCPEASVVHDARRSSHREPRFTIWHLQSMLRYFLRHLGRLPARQPGS